MNDEELSFWQEYVRAAADKLGLREKRITVKREEPKDDDAVACVWTLPSVEHAYVYLSQHFRLVSAPEDQRATVVHELLHIHTATVDAHVRWAVNRLEKDSLLDALPSLIEEDIEALVDRLSYVLAPLIPLPEGAPPHDR